VCDLGRDTWELVSVVDDLDACPSPRSGHRMAVWGKTLVLFGGYYSAGELTKYFNDLWLFDLDSGHWERAEFPSGALLPDPRSGCQIAVHEDMLYVFGGFARSRPPEIQKMLQEQRQQKGRRNHEEEFLLEAMAEEQESGVYYNDVWRVNLKDVVQSIASRKATEKPADPTAPPPRVVVALWEHVRAAGKGMNPARSGFTAGAYKDRVFFFGGVCDNDEYDSDEDDEEAAEGEHLVGDSMFFNELVTFNIAKQKWFQTKMKERKGTTAEAEPVVPSVRYGTQSTVLGSDMYLFGGMVEKRLNTRRRSVVEVTYDDLYKLSLSKLDGFTMILPPTTGTRRSKTTTTTSTTTTTTTTTSTVVETEKVVSKPSVTVEEVSESKPIKKEEEPAVVAAAAATTVEEEEEDEEEEEGDDDDEVEVVPEYLVDLTSSSDDDEDEDEEDGDDDDDDDDDDDEDKEDKEDKEKENKEEESSVKEKETEEQKQN